MRNRQIDRGHDGGVNQIRCVDVGGWDSHRGSVWKSRRELKERHTERKKEEEDIDWISTEIKQ